jgi:cephalosporin-C deacetylase-like acetyl esterase
VGLLAATAEDDPVAGLLHSGRFVTLRTLTQTAPDTLVVEGEPQDPATAAPGSTCPLSARLTYRFLPDHLEVLVEQSLDQYGAFAWAPADCVTASRDALTDCPTRPGEAALYGQTDPRWTTAEGVVLRFDFGVWQRGFANANWRTAEVGGESRPVLEATVPAAAPTRLAAYPLAQPDPQDALTFDVSAASPDFLLAGDQPAHFDIRVTNTAAEAVEAGVRFEVRDYLTREPVAARTTEVQLAGQAATELPTDLPLERPGPYRAAIVVEDGGAPARSYEWVFGYDFAAYRPGDTRPADFVQFWQEALAESAATPLDVRMTPVPEHSTGATDAFRISFATLGGRRIYGWYARPKAPGRYPAQARFPSSGIYPLPAPEAAADRCCLWILIHGFDVDLSNMPAGDDPGKSYWTAGIDDPRTSMWRTIYVSLVRSVDFLLAQPEVDPSRLAVVGGSQGGGLAMVAAGLDPRIGLAMPYHSGLPRLDWTVTHEPGYWPFGMGARPPGQTEGQFLRTLSYFDAANFTGDISCPVVAEVGLMDTVTAAGNQLCALAHVPRERLFLVCSPWAMHGAGSRAPSLTEECYARFRRGEAPLPSRVEP